MDAPVTRNADIGHIWEQKSKWITEGDKEAAYHAGKLKAEEKWANPPGPTRNCPGTVNDVPQQSEKWS